MHYRVEKLPDGSRKLTVTARIDKTEQAVMTLHAEDAEALKKSVFYAATTVHNNRKATLRARAEMRKGTKVPLPTPDTEDSQ